MEELSGSSQSIFPWEDILHELEVKHGGMPDCLRTGLRTDFTNENETILCFPENLIQKTTQEYDHSAENQHKSSLLSNCINEDQKGLHADTFELSYDHLQRLQKLDAVDCYHVSSSNDELHRVFSGTDGSGREPNENLTDVYVASPELHRRSPGADSGCSVGFPEDDDDDVGLTIPFKRIEKLLQKLKQDMREISDMSVSIAKQFIFAFDILEDIKWQTENGSLSDSKESVSGSKDSVCSSDRAKRQREYFLGRLSKSTSGVCIDALIRSQMRRSNELLDLRENLDERFFDASYHADRVKVKTSPKRQRRASAESASKSSKKTAFHYRSSSMDTVVEPKDTWMENMFANDKTRRETDGPDEFAKLVREETLQFQNWKESNEHLSATHIETDELLAMEVNNSATELLQTKNANYNKSTCQLEVLSTENATCLENTFDHRTNSMQQSATTTNQCDKFTLPPTENIEYIEDSMSETDVSKLQRPSSIFEKSTIMEENKPHLTNDKLGNRRNFFFGEDEDDRRLDKSSNTPPLSPDKPPKQGSFLSNLRRSYNERRDRTREPIMTGVVLKKRPESLSSYDLGKPTKHLNIFNRGLLNRRSLKKKQEQKREIDGSENLRTPNVHLRETQRDIDGSLRISTESHTVKRHTPDSNLSPIQWIHDQPQGTFV